MGLRADAQRLGTDRTGVLGEDVAADPGIDTARTEIT